MRLDIESLWALMVVNLTYVTPPTLLQVLSQAGAHVKDEPCRSLIHLICNTPELHGYATRAMYRNLVAYQDVAEESLLVTATW